MEYSYNRLTVLGSKAAVRRFVKSRWNKALGAQYAQLLESSPGRYICQFDTNVPPCEALRKLSRRWPRLDLMLDWESESQSAKGLVHAKAGRLASCRMEY